MARNRYNRGVDSFGSTPSNNGSYSRNQNNSPLFNNGMLDVGGLMSSLNIKTVITILEATKSQIEEKIERKDFVNRTAEDAKEFRNAVSNVLTAVSLVPDALNHLTGTATIGDMAKGDGIFELAKKGIRASSLDMKYIRGDIMFVIEVIRSGISSMDEINKGDGLVALLDIIKHLVNDIDMEAELAARIVKEGVRALFEFKPDPENNDKGASDYNNHGGVDGAKELQSKLTQVGGQVRTHPKAGKLNF